VVDAIRHQQAGPAGGALHAALANRPADDPLAGFYRARAWRPLWVEGSSMRPEAGRLVTILRWAGRDGLSPNAYQPARLATALAEARSGAPAALARAELMLSSAYAAYAADLHRPPVGAQMSFVDPAVAAPRTDPRGVLEAAARAPSLAEALTNAQRMNPVYEGLRDALAAIRSTRGGANPRDEALILINMARARALPADLGPRYILVNPAAQALWLFEDGRPNFQMPVVVGKPSEPTPAMIGLIRYVDLDPYWNVPPDLAREVARKVLTSGPELLAQRHLEALSDWSPQAVTVAPEAVDWAAVAQGARTLRLRQLPGPDNMMGKLKFMLPNPLGVYLHDTPMKSLFAAATRTDSAGCVRLADAEALARRLFGHDLADDPAAGPEQRVDLPAPVPVYILYLTAAPAPGGGVAHLPDIYGRDPPLLARLAA
jgi:murein L,D-transpeptidase YcbB/YkuD